MSLKLDESDEMIESVNKIEDNLKYIEKETKNNSIFNNQDIENRIIETEKEINYIKTELSCLPPSYSKKHNPEKYRNKLLELKSNLKFDNCQIQIKEPDANEEAKHALIKNNNNNNKDEFKKQIKLNEKKQLKQITFIVFILVLISIIFSIVKRL